MSDIGRITQLTTENKDRTDFHGVQCAIVPESTIEEWRADRDRLQARVAEQDAHLESLQNRYAQVTEENAMLRAVAEAAEKWAATTRESEAEHARAVELCFEVSRWREAEALK